MIQRWAAPYRAHNALVAVALLWTASARAEPANIAVAANFAAPARALAERFETERGQALRIVTGATGALYLQISQGAPFAALLAADQARPARLEAEGLAVAGSRFTYAFGQLVLYRRGAGPVDLETLKAGRFERLAIANPATAPYGVAALEALAALGLKDATSGKLARGKNVAQAFQFAWTGAAEFSLVAKAQALAAGAGGYWDVPPALYAPIAQDAVLIAGAPEAAESFLRFLRSDDARTVIQAMGYGLPD